MFSIFTFCCTLSALAQYLLAVFCFRLFCGFLCLCNRSCPLQVPLLYRHIFQTNSDYLQGYWQFSSFSVNHKVRKNFFHNLKASQTHFFSGLIRREAVLFWVCLWRIGVCGMSIKNHSTLICNQYKIIFADSVLLFLHRYHFYLI